MAERMFEVQLHHSLLDVWSLNFICELIECAYHGQNLDSRPFASWIKHVLAQDHRNTDKFWRSEFAGLKTVHFPCSAAERSTTVLPQSKQVVSHTINTVATYESSVPYTVATFLRLAWAIFLWQRTGSEDVVFGATAMGKPAAWEVVRQLTGPIIAVVPVRIRLSSTEQSVEQALSQTQDQLARMIAYEQTGLERIRMAGFDASAACDFQNFLVIQPEQQQQASQSGDFSSPSIQKYENLLSFSIHPFTLCCMVQNGAIEFQACVEPSVMTPDNARVLLRQMGHVYGELVKHLQARLKDIGARSMAVD